MLSTPLCRILLLKLAALGHLQRALHICTTRELRRDKKKCRRLPQQYLTYRRPETLTGLVISESVQACSTEPTLLVSGSELSPFERSGGTLSGTAHTSPTEVTDFATKGECKDLVCIHADSKDIVQDHMEKWTK